MSISVAVMAHRARETEASILANLLALEGRRDIGVAMDDGTRGENANGDHAWNLCERDAEWGIVLQDDALPLDDFEQHAARALDDLGHYALVSFYVGTSRPRLRQHGIETAIRQADAFDLAWLTYPSLLWGVAVALPTLHIDRMLDWVRTCDKPYDRRLGAYAQHAGLPVMYCWPSLVDHADGPGLVRHKYDTSEPRKAWRIGTRYHYRTAAARIT